MSEKSKKSERSSFFRLIFANAFRLRVGNNDVGITLAVETDGPDGEAYFVDEAQVLMTPASAKLLAHMLQNAIKVFERENGPILLAPGKLDELDRALAERGITK